MKKALKIVGILLGVIILVVAIAAAYFNFKSLPTYEAEEIELNIQVDSALLARGEYIVNLNCQFCHIGKEGSMSGQKFEENPLGTFYASNITRHETAGIGDYTDGQLAYLLRTGIKPGGELAMPMMPKFNHLSDPDLKAVIAFLRSDHRLTAPSDNEPPTTQLNLLGKVLANLAFKPLPYPEAPISHPDPTDQIAYGRYISTAAIHCYHCHSASFEGASDLDPEASEGYFGGGNMIHNLYEPGEWVLSSNLTMHTESGIGNWTPEEFVSAVKTGQGRDGEPLSSAMPRFTTMTDEDVRAIHAYLKTIPVIDNDISGLEVVQQ
jgi:mono/diheme cytochrome c family protein